MDAVITGADPAAYAPASLSGVTVAVSSEFDEKLHASQTEALEKAVAALEAKGATVKRGASLADVRAGVEGFDEPSYRLQGTYAPNDSYVKTVPYLSFNFINFLSSLDFFYCYYRLPGLLPRPRPGSDGRQNPRGDPRGIVLRQREEFFP